METRGITFQMLQFICEHAYSDDRKLYCRYRDFCDAFKKDVACNADNCFMWAKLKRNTQES